MQRGVFSRKHAGTSGQSDKNARSLHLQATERDETSARGAVLIRVYRINRSTRERIRERASLSRERLSRGGAKDVRAVSRAKPTLRDFCRFVTRGMSHMYVVHLGILFILAGKNSSKDHRTVSTEVQKE